MEIERVFETVRADPASLGTAGVTEGLAACGRLRSFVDAQEARFLAEAARLKASTGSGVFAPDAVLAEATGVSKREARKRAKVARELERLPRVADGLANGELTFEHASLLADAHEGQAREVEAAEAELVDLAKESNPDQLRAGLARWRREHSGDDGESDLARKRRGRSAKIFDTDDGLIGLFAQLDPIWGAEVTKAIEFHADRLWRAETQTDTPTHIPRSRRHQLYADALVEMARLSTTPDTSSDVVSAPPHMTPVVVISINWLLGHLDTLGFSELVDGTPIPVTEVRKLAAQVGVIPVVMDTDGTVLDMGRRTRTATNDQKLALQVRDGPCAHPDCDTT
ncbi:MAG: DUF222 domain-containing protein, partial [Acidimicrobiales bacterium]